MEMTTASASAILCPTWKQLLEWHACDDFLGVAGTLWPEWNDGPPPTLAEFAASTRVPRPDRIWLLARVLRCCSRKVCLFWAADCAEAALRCVHEKWLIDHSLGVLSAIRCAAAEGEYADFSYAAAAYAVACDVVDEITYPAAEAIAFLAVAGRGLTLIVVADVAGYAADISGASDTECDWQIDLALGYLGVAKLPAWPEGMVWRD